MVELQTAIWTLRQKGELYKACIRSVLVYGAECWAMRAQDLRRLISTERRMLRFMCGVSLSNRVGSSEVRQRLGVESIEDWIRCQRLRWFGHVKRRDSEEEIRKVLEFKPEGISKRGRPLKRWMNVIKEQVSWRWDSSC